MHPERLDDVYFPYYTALLHGPKFYPQQLSGTMMPPSSHTMKQSTHQYPHHAVVNVPHPSLPVSQLTGGVVPGSNNSSIGLLCNEQNVRNENTSSFAAALRKLAKKAVDPVTEQERNSLSPGESSALNVRNLKTSGSMPISTNSSSLSPAQYKRPPPPPLVQSKQLQSVINSSVNITPVMNTSPTSLVCGNNKGLDFSIRRESLHPQTMTVDGYNANSGIYSCRTSTDQSLYPSGKDYSSSNVSSMRSQCIPTVSSSSHVSDVAFHPYSRQNTVDGLSKPSDLSTHASFDHSAINTSPFANIYPAFFSSVPSTAYRYNNVNHQSVYMDHYASLLRPAVHHPGLVLPPSTHYHSSGLTPSSSSYPGSVLSGRTTFNSNFSMLSPKTSNSSLINVQNHNSVRLGNAVRKWETDNDTRLLNSKCYNSDMNSHTIPSLHSVSEVKLHPSNPSARSSLEMQHYENISPSGDQNYPLSLTTTHVIRDTEHSTSSHESSSTNMTSPKESIDLTLHSRRSSIHQTPKERYKQLCNRKSQDPRNQNNDEPNDLRMNKNQTGRNADYIDGKRYTIPDGKDANSRLPKQIDDSLEHPADMTSKSLISATHYLPVRHIEARRSINIENMSLQNNVINGRTLYDNASAEKTSSKADIRRETAIPPAIPSSTGSSQLQTSVKNDAAGKLQDNYNASRNKAIFNPAFYDRSVSMSKTKNVESTDSNSKDNIVSNLFSRNVIPAVVLAADVSVISKLDREMSRLNEYRRYNRFAGSDQSDDEVTDIDEDDFVNHEQIRQYHLMTIMAGPPLKLDKSPQKRKFLKMLGLTTHKSKSDQELKMLQKRRKYVNDYIYTDDPNLVRIEGSEAVLRLTRSKKGKHSNKRSKKPSKQLLMTCKNSINRNHGNFQSKLKFFRILGLEHSSTDQKLEQGKIWEQIVNERLRRTRLPLRDRYCDGNTSKSFDGIEESVPLSEFQPTKAIEIIDLDHSAETAKVSSPVSTKSVLSSSSDVEPNVTEMGAMDSVQSKIKIIFQESKSDDFPVDKEFVQEFHKSVLRTTQDQEAQKLAAARIIGPSQGGAEVNDSCIKYLTNQSEIASNQNNINDSNINNNSSSSSSAAAARCSSSSITDQPVVATSQINLDDKLESSSSSINYNNQQSNLKSSSLLSSSASSIFHQASNNHQFKWPGIQAIMEAYERHYDLQKLEKDVLSNQCQCLKLKNKELMNLAEKLRSRMCDLMSSKRQLDNERQQRQYAIDNLKRCLKEIR